MILLYLASAFLKNFRHQGFGKKYIETLESTIYSIIRFGGAKIF